MCEKVSSVDANRLRDQILDNSAAKLAELFEAASVIKGEFVVIEPEELQKGDVEVTDVGFAFDGFHSKFVGGTNRVTRIAAATGQPDSHGVRIVISTVSRSATHTVVRSAAKLAAPDDKRAFEQAPLLEISNERGNGLIDASNKIAVGALDVVVTVP